MTQRWYIGLSASESLLGVDAALVRVEGQGTELALRLEQHQHVPYARDLRELLWHVRTAPSAELRHLGMLHRVLGETFALAVRHLLEQRRLPTQEIFCVACPGQELWHDTESRYPAHLSLGMAGVLAERTGLTTVTDFAGRDMAVGGQGWPLTTLVDALLFHSPREHRLLLHLGSVASVMSLPAQCLPHGRNVIAFQAAPGTGLLDGLMRHLTNGREHFDAGGKHAVQGRCLDPLLERWLQHPFFQRRPPRCVPPHEFGPDFWNQAVEQARQIEGNLHDVLCTMTHFVARAILQAITSHVPTPPSRVLLSGRGVRNGFLWHLLEQSLGTVPMETIETHGIPTEARKAVAYAGLAALTMDGVPINVPGVTGATGPRLLGQFTPGSSGNWARCLAWMARQNAPLQSAAA
jgi:anhydro-N-acetylmuramic acid kinase